MIFSKKNLIGITIAVVVGGLAFTVSSIVLVATFPASALVGVGAAVCAGITYTSGMVVNRATIDENLKNNEKKIAESMASKVEDKKTIELIENHHSLKLRIDLLETNQQKKKLKPNRISEIWIY